MQSQIVERKLRRDICVKHVPPGANCRRCSYSMLVLLFYVGPGFRFLVLLTNVSPKFFAIIIWVIKFFYLVLGWIKVLALPYDIANSAPQPLGYWSKGCRIVPNILPHFRGLATEGGDCLLTASGLFLSSSSSSIISRDPNANEVATTTAAVTHAHAPCAPPAVRP